MARRRKPLETLDELRRFIVERGESLGKSLSDLSRALPDREGLPRNEKFMWDFVWKRSPKKLDEDDRPVLAAELDTTESHLRRLAAGLADPGRGYGEPPPSQPPEADDEIESVDSAELLGWLAEQLKALHEEERAPMGLAEAVIAAVHIHEKIGEVLSVAAYRKAAERALQDRRQALRRHRAAWLKGETAEPRP